MSYEYLDEKDADKNADGLKYRTHSELRSQLAQQKALLDEAVKVIEKMKRNSCQCEILENEICTPCKFLEKVKDGK